MHSRGWTVRVKAATFFVYFETNAADGMAACRENSISSVSAMTKARCRSFASNDTHKQVLIQRWGERCCLCLPDTAADFSVCVPREAKRNSLRTVSFFGELNGALPLKIDTSAAHTKSKNGHSVEVVFSLLRNHG